MNAQIAVIVIEEVRSARELMYQKRQDLQFALRGGTYTELKKKARISLREKGWEVFSIAYESKEVLRVMVRKPGSMSAAPIRKQLTASKRVR